MQTHTPKLYVEINKSNYIFAVCLNKEHQGLEIIEKLIISNKSINNNKLVDLVEASKVIKTNIEIIENKLNYIFKDVIVTIDNFDYTCINISGFKKLNGSQVLKENISYILNSLKLTISENIKEKTILHIFNSKSILDGSIIENLPIGLFGDFYSHELSFLLIKNNDLKNIKQIFNKNSLNVKKVLIKKFIEGTQLINTNQNIKTFFKIDINKENTSIIFFDNSSFVYKEDFNFGTNILRDDIAKICSINSNFIESILLDKIFANKVSGDNDHLEKKYFINENYRKIRKKLILDIVDARIEEIFNIILNKNINTKYFMQKKGKIYLTVEDEIIFINFKKIFNFYFSQKNNFGLNQVGNFEIDSIIISALELSTFGWKKEAIPVVQSKNSLITRIFKYLFG